MNCPECGAWSLVKETRRKIVRRRECANGHLFTTIETLHKTRNQNGNNTGRESKKESERLS